MTRDIHIERNGKRIELRSRYSPEIPALCKSVPGGKWKPEGKFWHYPLDMSTCHALRAAFGDRLDVGPELFAWARDASQAARVLENIAASDSAELHNVPKYAPMIDAAMRNRTYQQVAAAYGARAGSFHIFDQPGLGKTIMALGAIVEAQGPTPGAHLILCPKTAVGVVWGPEIRQWLPDAEVFELRGTRAQREATFVEARAAIDRRTRKCQVFVVGNIEMARLKGETDPETGKKRFPITTAEWPELFTIDWDTVIVDESHRALIRKTGTPTQTRAGMEALGKRCQRRIPLSGTPMRGKATNLWGTLNWMRPDLFTSYWKWAARYFKIGSNGFSSYVIDPNDQWLPDGEYRLGEDLKQFGLRRTKAEVLAELPPKTYAGTYLIPGDENSPHGVWLTLEGKQAKQYATMEREGAISVDSGEVSTVGHLAEATRLKQIAGAVIDVSSTGKVTPELPSVKFDWLVDKLGELGILDNEGDGKIVVASQFTSLLNLFARELREMGVALHLLTGETPDKARQEMSEDFQTSDAVRVFLLNTQAGGVAITLDRADDLVLLDETYSPDDQEQVEDRIHRTSRIHNVTIHQLKCLDTIEEEIAWITAARESVTQYLLDGARGVKQAKQRYIAKAAA